MMEAISSDVKFTGVEVNSNVTTNTVNNNNKRFSVQPQKPDEFVKHGEDSNKNNSNKLSTKTAVGIGAGLACLGTILFLIAKGRTSEAKNLAEHIDFKPAKTVEEARKFGAENLGIKRYLNFESEDLDAINWINEGLVNVSNRFKGKLRMPKMIGYFDSKVLGENVLAGVLNDKSAGKYNGFMGVNKNFFSNPVKFVEERIQCALNSRLLSKDADNNLICNSVFSKEVREAVGLAMQDFQQNKNLSSALRAHEVLEACSNHNNYYINTPLNTIKQLIKDDACKEFFTKRKILCDLDEIKKLSLEEQKNLRREMVVQLHCEKAQTFIKEVKSKDKNLALKVDEFIQTKSNKLADVLDFVCEQLGEKPDLNVVELAIPDIGNVSQFRTIYHEMGHLQDMKPRCRAAGTFKSESEYPKELKEWLENSEYQQIANMVSPYSTTGPGEFIAETFAKMIEGRTLKPEVRDLYQKLSGPVVPDA